jgi:hypothetical protein
MRAFTSIFLLQGVRLLSRRTVPGRILQSWAYLTAMKAHVSQLPIAETAQDDQSRLVFSLSEKGRDPSIDDIKKPSADGADTLPNVRRAGITGAAVQQGHRLLPSVVLLSFLQHADLRRRRLSDRDDFSSRTA